MHHLQWRCCVYSTPPVDALFGAHGDLEVQQLVLAVHKGDGRPLRQVQLRDICKRMPLLGEDVPMVKSYAWPLSDTPPQLKPLCQH
jgi:hypothetical protein